MDRVYSVYLDSQEIGVTRLEKADASMGVAFGLINFRNVESPYQLFREYCLENGIIINTDDPEVEFIDTQVIKSLKVFRSDGLEIKGEVGNAICGIKEEGYEISILGIGYPFYEEEFPHHVKEYKNRSEE